MLGADDGNFRLSIRFDGDGSCRFACSVEVVIIAYDDAIQQGFPDLQTQETGKRKMMSHGMNGWRSLLVACIHWPAQVPEGYSKVGNRAPALGGIWQQMLLWPPNEWSENQVTEGL